MYSQIEVTHFSASHLKVNTLVCYYSWEAKATITNTVMDAKVCSQWLMKVLKSLAIRIFLLWL